MKTIIGSLILLAAIALPVHAAPPLPATSSVELKMTRTVEIQKEPTKGEHDTKDRHECFGDVAHCAFEPIFQRGLDAKSSTLVLNIYFITSDTNRRFAILKPISQIIPSDPTTHLVKSIKTLYLKWRCKCRTRGDTMDKDLEWYAEVIQDGKILCFTQSKTNTEIKKLIETRKVLSEAEVKALPVPGKSLGTKPILQHP